MCYCFLNFKNDFIYLVLSSCVVKTIMDIWISCDENGIEIDKNIVYYFLTLVVSLCSFYGPISLGCDLLFLIL
jgi:hypothetical protein